MAVKTFTTGEVLTAADTNTYLANGGLVYIGTVSYSAAAAVNANSVFTSTYRNYRIVGSHTPSSGIASFRMRLRASSTDQTGANYQFTSARLYTNNAQDASNAAQDYTQLANGGIANDLFCFAIDVFSPQINSSTVWTADCSNFESASAGVRWWAMGGYKANYQADGFTLYPTSGTWTGQLQVYGYRIP